MTTSSNDLESRVPEIAAKSPAMTIAVIRLLAPLIDNDEVRPVSWRMLLPALQKQFGTQRPNFVGPVDRIPFSQATRTGSRVAIFTTAPDTYIRLGSPAGVSNGDVYGVVSAGGADLGGDDTILAELTVDDVSATDAHVTVHWLQEDQPELASMAAKLLSTASTRYIVAVAGSAAAETLLRETLEASPLVEVGEAGGEDYLGVVRVADDSFELEDVNHHVIATGKYPIEITALVGHLEDLATTRRLRSLGTGTSPSGSDIEVTLVRYRDGQSQVVANTGELFMTGDRFAVQLRNRLSVNAGATRYVNLVYIDAAGRLRLLNGDVGGISIDPRSSSGDVTRVPDPGDQIWGFPLDWPAGMNTSRPRPVSIAAIVTTDLADLRTLTDPGVIQTRASNDSSRDLTSRRSSHDELDLGMVRYTDAIIWMELELAHDDALANLRSRSSDLARRFRLTASNLDHDRRVDVLLVSRSQRWASATLQLGSAAITWQGDSDDTLEVFAWTSTSNQRISLRDRLVMTGTVEPSSIADESCSPAVSPGRVMADRAIAALGDSATLVFHRAVSSAVLDDLVSLEVEGIQLTVQEIDY